jgi:hypothetical protein
MGCRLVAVAKLPRVVEYAAWRIVDTHLDSVVGVILLNDDLVLHAHGRLHQRGHSNHLLRGGVWPA